MKNGTKLIKKNKNIKQTNSNKNLTHITELNMTSTDFILLEDKLISLVAVILKP